MFTVKVVAYQIWSPIWDNSPLVFACVTVSSYGFTLPLQFSSNYERYAYDAIFALSAVVNRSKTEEDASIVDHVNNISFHGASVSFVHTYL